MELPYRPLQLLPLLLLQVVVVSGVLFSSVESALCD